MAFEDITNETVRDSEELRIPPQSQTTTFDADWRDEYERAAIIALARRLDSATLDSEACAAGPGRYEGASDLALVVALDILSMHGCADDSAGSCDETGRYLQRFGRFLLQTDSQGFVTAWREDTDELAQAEIDDENARYIDVEVTD